MQEIMLVNIEKLLEMRINQRDFKLVEALDEKSYKEGHIPGALNLPVTRDSDADEVGRKAADLGIEKDDPVVVYCASYTCGTSTRATRLLQEAGYGNVVDFKAGKAGWKKAGFDLES